MTSKKHSATTKNVASSTSCGTRGATMAKEVTKAIAKGDKFEVEWDDHGQSIGPHAAELKSFIGTTVKRLVPIIYSDWRVVPQTLKDLVWKEVLTAFVLPMQKKEWMLKVANTLWRKFKSDLTRFHMCDKDGEILPSPPELYTQYISEDQWSEFTKSRQTQEFQESSEAHRQLSLKVEYPYRGSRKGYPGIREQMRKELGTIGGRQDLWKRARQKKDGSFSSEVQDMIDKMQQISEQEKAGEIVFSGREDSLSLALEKQEHPGRVRGVGQYVTITDFFRNANQDKSFGGLGVEKAVVYAVKEINEKMENKITEMQESHAQSQAKSQSEIKEMQNFIFQLLEKMKEDNPDLPTPMFGRHSTPIDSRTEKVASDMSIPVGNHQPVKASSIHQATVNDSPAEELASDLLTSKSRICVSKVSNVSQSLKASSNHQTTQINSSTKSGVPVPEVSKVVKSVMASSIPQTAQTDSSIEEYSPCYLFSPTTREKVAIGSVCRSTSSAILLHHKQLEPGFVKVQVITPLQGDVELPQMTDEVITVYDAVGSFVAWPADLVSTSMESEPPRKDTCTNRKRKAMTNEPIDLVSSNTTANSFSEKISCFAWYHRAMGKTARCINLSESIMGFEHEIMVGKLDVGILLEKKGIGAAHVSLYIKYLWDNHCSMNEHMYGFLCPSSVSPGRKSLRDRQQYVAKAIMGDIEMKMVFAPYNLGFHWALVVINVKDDTVYYLDSVGDKIPLDVISFFETSLKVFWADRQRKKPRMQTRWVKVHCPRSSGKADSGYYMLRFMREVIEKRYTNSIPEQYYRRQHNTYSKEEIDEIRVEWLDCFSQINDD